MAETIQNPVWLSIVLGICVGGPLVTYFLCRILRMIEVTSTSYHESRLKRTLAERGFTPEQIQEIALAKAPRKPDPGDWEPIPPKTSVPR